MIPLATHLAKARERLALAQEAQLAGDEAGAARHLEAILDIADYVQLDGSPGLAAARASARDAWLLKTEGGGQRTEGQRTEA